MGCWLINNATPFELPACLDNAPWILKAAFASQRNGHCHIAVLDGAHRLLMALVHLGHLDTDENSGVPEYRLFIHPSSSVGGFCHWVLVNGVPFMAKEGEMTKTYLSSAANIQSSLPANSYSQSWQKMCTGESCGGGELLIDAMQTMDILLLVTYDQNALSHLVWPAYMLLVSSLVIH